MAHLDDVHPRERRNIASSHPALRGRMLAELRALRSRLDSIGEPDLRPIADVPGALDRQLRALGYAE